MIYRLVIRGLVLFQVVFNSNEATADILSEHYKLAVGQGECSTTISTLTQKDIAAAYKVAVTADIGSSSLRADPKYVSGYNYDRFDPILERKQVVANDEGAMSNERDQQKRRLQPRPQDCSLSPSLVPQLEMSLDKKIPTTSLTGESTFEGSFDFLINQLQNIDLWIVFLSHPDKDHINWLSTVFDKLAATTKLILIAGGEWLNTTSTEDIREVLGLVYNTDKTHRILSFFPYKDGTISGEDMDEWLKKNGNNIKRDDPRTFCPRRELNGKRLDQFHGTLTELFGVYSEKKPFDFIGLSLENPLGSALINSILDRIYIWSLDYPIGNTNAQSIVWSHEVDDIGWTFVYTGDAENCTFKKIRSSLTPLGSKNEAKDVIRGRQKTVTAGVKNLIMMQGMHHGSVENVSSIAMELFCPNVIVFSAGNGASFAHPSITAIQKYQEFFSDPKNSLLASSLWSAYILRNPSYSFAAFSQRGDGAQGKALSIKMKDEKALFLCTNSYGTIKISADSLSIPYNEIPEYVGYYDLHAYERVGTLQDIFTHLQNNTLSLKTLAKTHEESYQEEPFRQDLQNYQQPLSLVSNLLLRKSEDCLIIKIDDNYALKAIQKTRKESGQEKSYVYFYVLRKLVSADTGILPAEED